MLSEDVDTITEVLAAVVLILVLMEYALRVL